MEVIMTLDEFVIKYNGKKVCNGGLCQCVALARQYLDDVLNMSQFPQVQGAYQVYDVAQGFDKVLNSPSGVPPRGSIIIWKKEYGGNGHIGIVLDADINGILVFSQNHTGNNDPCKITSYNYNLVRGWLIKGDDMIGKLYNNSLGQVWLSFDNKKFYVEDPKSIEGLSIINGDAPGVVMIKKSDEDAHLAEQRAEFDAQIIQKNLEFDDLKTAFEDDESKIDELHKLIDTQDTTIDKLKKELNDLSNTTACPSLWVCIWEAIKNLFKKE